MKAEKLHTFKCIYPMQISPERFLDLKVETLLHFFSGGGR